MVCFNRYRKYCSAVRLRKVWDMYPSTRSVCKTKNAKKIVKVRGAFTQELAFVTWVSYIALWGERAREETRFDFYGPSGELREETF